MRIVGFERQRSLETGLALFEFQFFLQNNAQIVPGGGKLGRERHRAARGFFPLVEQAALTAHFGEIAEIDSGSARRLASPANMLNREIEIAEVIGEQTHQISRVHVPRPRRQHLLAMPFRVVRAPGQTRRSRLGDGVRYIESC